MKKSMIDSIESILESVTIPGNGIESPNWSVSGSPAEGWDFECYSPQGEDVIFSVTGRTMREIAEDARQGAEAFDAEEHAAAILIAKRTGEEDMRRYYASAPDSLRALLEDADWIDAAQAALASELEKAAFAA
jgi:hypothetical protein